MATGLTPLGPRGKDCCRAANTADLETMVMPDTKNHVEPASLPACHNDDVIHKYGANMYKYYDTEYRKLYNATSGCITPPERRLIAAIWRATAHLTEVKNEYRQRARSAKSEHASKRLYKYADTIVPVIDSLEQDILEALRCIAEGRVTNPAVQSQSDETK